MRSYRIRTTLGEDVYLNADCAYISENALYFKIKDEDAEPITTAVFADWAYFVLTTFESVRN